MYRIGFVRDVIYHTLVALIYLGCFFPHVSTIYVSHMMYKFSEYVVDPL